MYILTRSYVVLYVRIICGVVCACYMVCYLCSDTSEYTYNTTRGFLMHILHVRLSDALPKGNAARVANASASASCILLDGMAVVVYMIDIRHFHMAHIHMVYSMCVVYVCSVFYWMV